MTSTNVPRCGVLREDTEQDEFWDTINKGNFGLSSDIKKRQNGNHRHHGYQSFLPNRCKTKMEPSSNPLLDTISVLTLDSDDYSDLSSVYQSRRFKSKSEGSSIGPYPLGDVDSIGYAGSNSIDSGYKSLCPTPEIPDYPYYGGLKPRTVSLSRSNSTSVPNYTVGGKPKIAMGTKVMVRNSPKTVPSSRHSSDSGLYDVNLDHLMYLRQSLLSAIQHYEIPPAKPDDKVHHQENILRNGVHRESSFRKEKETAIVRSINLNEPKKKDGSPTQTLHCSTTSGLSQSSPFQKTVRFETDLKLSPSSCKAKSVNSKKQSKSILKDPLCAHLKAQLESNAPLSTDCTLEEEIDTLLFGRAEYYDLESVNDFPCSYVTMIEEKYRCGRSSVAKVRKLKERTVESQEEPSNNEKSTESSQVQRKIPSDPDDICIQRSTVEKEPKALGTASKSRFTEVAKCMLEIIEDLQIKKLLENKTVEIFPNCAESVDQDISPSSTNVELAVKPPQDTNRGGSFSFETSSSSGVSSVSYTTSADYHVYEEIAYECVGLASSEVNDLPPPLPARPSSMLQKQDRIEAPSNKDGYSRGSEQNRPKQRSNLYSLFADQRERRDISKSLEREWKASFSADDPEDEYGFKKSSSSM